MSTLEERLGYRLPAEGDDAAARARALGQVTAGGGAATTLVTYRSSGRLAVLAPAERAGALDGRWPASLQGTLILAPGVPAPDTHGDVRVIHAEVTALAGHLGDFRMRARAAGEEIDLAPSIVTGHQPFELVLDLRDDPGIDAEVPPPGYFHAPDDEALDAALAELPDLVGEFDKPRYYRYDADICAHGRRGVDGCTRCLDACPTGAITSIGDAVEVDPYLCQGAGGCVAACPTGAITYAYPAAPDLVDGVREVLGVFREAGGARALALFHDAGAGRQWVAEQAGSLPGAALPFEVEEIGSVSLETLLATLAYGAARVVLMLPVGLPAGVRRALEQECEVANALLDAMGWGGARVALTDASGAPGFAFDEVTEGAAPARFAPVGGKRAVLRLAIEHLHDAGGASAAEVALPAHAPFGEIRVDREACTLCMACVSVCPASALEAGGETPALRFVEWNCVQCGLCERACPEDAIERAPRFLFDANARMRARSLNEEAPFDCVVCGKPFATASVIERMRTKLAGHWMFREPAALRRLEMCEDCRVKDVFADGGGTLPGWQDGPKEP